LSEREHCEVYRAWLVAELVDVDTVLAGLMADGTPFARPVGVEAVAQSRKQQEARAVTELEQAVLNAAVAWRAAVEA
jgi:hypothetical protein